MRRLATSLIVLGCLCLTYNVRAAVMIALELRELVAQSDYVVVANAQSAASRYAGKLIVTDVTLKVVTSLKGKARPGDELKVTHLGGAVGEVGLQVPGAASFALGDSTISFLRRDPKRGDLNVVGMSQGVWPITGNGPEAQVGVGGASGAQLMQRDARGVLVEAPHRAAEKRALADVLGEIDQLVRAR